MAQWRAPSYKYQTEVKSLGDGVNTGVPPFDIRESELTYARNLGSQDYPAITTRYGRTFYSTAMSSLSTNASGFGERANSQLHFIDGNAWKYWSTSSTGFVELSTSLTSGAEAAFSDFVSGANRYTLMMNSTQLRYWNGASSTASTLGDATTPYTNIFTVHKGRIYAAKGSELFYSALNLINDWTTPNDAGSISITQAKGNIIALIEYNDKVIAFTEYGMHELFGTGPLNYELVDIEGEIGCYSRKSLVKCNKKLYWYWLDGIYEYNGSSPIKVSTPVDEYLKKIPYANRDKVTCGSVGDYLYISIPHTTSNNDLVLVFDTRIGKWYIDTGNFDYFVKMGNSLYGLDSTGGVVNVRDDTVKTDNGTAISYDLITKPFTNRFVSQNATLSDMYFLISATTDTTINVSYSTNSTGTSTSLFKNIARTTDFNLTGLDQQVRVQVPTTDLQNVPFYRLRIDGTGDVTIHRWEKQYRAKRR